MSTITGRGMFRSVAAFLVVLGVNSAVGCGSDDRSRAGNSGGAGGGPDASLGSGGANATGGALGTGGTRADASTHDAAPDAACAPPATLLPLDSFQKCAVVEGGVTDGGAGVGPECIDGYCVAITLMTAVGVGQAQLDLLANCSATEKCVPGKFVQYQNKFTPKTCVSVAGAEGRCLSECIPQVSSQKSFLPVDVCDPGELCAPCYDPRTGLDTSACSQGCDTGPTKPPVVFQKCCGGNGDCVPKSVVPASQINQLGVDTCTGTDVLCAPTKFENLSYIPPTCRSLANLEGRCIPSCVPAVAAQASFLPQDICAADEKCAPCYDPIKGTATGACTLNGDTAKEPQVVFDSCCGNLGHCVPSTILSSSQQSLLGTDTCTKTGDLCAPDIFADPTKKPQTCRALSTFNAEGRCIPSCVPSVAAQASLLDQSTCDPGYLCAPCYDPRTGISTGACDQNGDAPVEASKTFQTCCGGNGSCVPTSIVPVENRSQLGIDTCTGTDVLCVPRKLQDLTYVPPTCTSLAGLEGRCMPSCIPAVAARASFLPQDICDADEKCAPCYDPITGAATGACTLNGDTPKNPATVFPICCSGVGHCVPSTILTSQQQGLLGTDTCTSPGDLCAPDIFADPAQKPQKCRALGSFDAEGRCLPTCIPVVAALASMLGQVTCDPGYACVPCYLPNIPGVSSGACDQNGDAPVEAPKSFQTCCGGSGQCFTTSLVFSGNQSLLGVDTCPSTDYLCTPTKFQGAPYVPPTCRSLSNLEGRCLPACLPIVAAEGSLVPQSTCDANEKCMPCYDPITGAATGACSTNGDAPLEPATTLATCCSGLGHCVPGSDLTSQEQSFFGADTCTNAGDLCAPDVFTSGTKKPQPCRALGSLDAEGRCIPSCVPSVAAQASRLDQSTCAAGYLCDPCYDPVTGASTGACTQNGDAPLESAKTYPACCQGTDPTTNTTYSLGICLPQSLVPPSEVNLLAQQTCGTGSLCTPKSLTSATAKPAACTTMSPLNVEGRCLPSCLPSVKQQALTLKRETCAAGELCDPCYNPIDGTATGACSLNGDAPVKPPFQFAGCCPTNGTNAGLCVPPYLATATPSSMLMQQACATGLVCAPALKLKNSTAKFPSCTYGFASVDCYPPIFNFGCSGACLPACFLTNAGGSPFFTQQTCSTGEQCAPCSSPVDGTTSGACN